MKNLNINTKRSLEKASRYSKPFIGNFSDLDIITPSLMEGNPFLSVAVLSPETKIIGESAFHGDTSLESVIGNPSIISDDAFSFCSKLKKFDFNSVTSIGAKAFQYSGLNKVTLGPDIKVIRESTFSGCLKLKEIDLANVESIEHHAFESTGLYNIVFSPKLKKIGNQAFEGCTYLKNVVCLTPIPPRICESTFNGSSIEKIWVVNERLKEEFKNARYWKNYSDKIEVIDWLEVADFTEKLKERDKKRTEELLFI